MSLSLATKAKSLQGHEPASETPTEAAPCLYCPPALCPLTCPCSRGGSQKGGEGTCHCWGAFPRVGRATPWPQAVPSPLAPAVVAANAPDTDVEDGLAVDEGAVEGVHKAHGVLLQNHH